MTIRKNAEKVLENVRGASERSGRKLEDITIIAVSKTVDSERAAEVLEVNGINALGENRVQEFTKKYEILADKQIDWHLIGHLQKNKVKYIIGKTKLIHSVESLALAQEINKRSIKANIKTKVLLEVNMAQEESKFGLKPDEVELFLKDLAELANIEIAGLMTVAPYVENPEDIRWVFKDMKKLFKKLSALDQENVDMKYLSMGMSNDYEIAIEEGANIVRIGTKIFGERNYNI